MTTLPRVWPPKVPATHPTDHPAGDEADTADPWRILCASIDALCDATTRRALIAADFGEAVVVIAGVEQKAYFFALDLPHSDACYIRAYRAATAEAWMRGERAELPTDLATREAIHRELLRVLAGHDPFWPRWIVRLEEADA